MMDLLKKLAIFMMAFALPFSFTACGDDDDDDLEELLEGGYSEKDMSYTYSDLKDNGKELSFIITAKLKGKKFYTQENVYGYEGNTITSYKEITTFVSNTYASAYYNTIKEDEMEEIVSINLKGSTVTVVYDASYIDFETVEEVKNMYAHLKEYGGFGD